MWNTQNGSGYETIKKMLLKKHGGKRSVAIEELTNFDHKDDNNTNEPNIGTQVAGWLIHLKVLMKMGWTILSGLIKLNMCM